MEIYAFDAFCPKEVIEKDGVKAVVLPKSFTLLAMSFPCIFLQLPKRRIPSIMHW